MAKAEEEDIVIVGGGICGLATALALHRKGIKSLVLERSESLRATGVAIGIFANGWRALHQLGIDSNLRSTAIRFTRAVDVWVDKGLVQEKCMSDEEARCLKRSDLIEALANELPIGTIHFGCQVISVNVERSSSNPVLQLHDGRLIEAKILIGCDGANSVVANFIGLKPTRLLPTLTVRGLTNYPTGHDYNPEMMRIRKDKHLLGRIPIDENTVYWFAVLQGIQTDAKFSKDQSSIRQMTLDSTSGFSVDFTEMIKNSDISSLSLTQLRYRAPWNLLSGNIRKGTATVAGDAWHVMGPFLGQGGSAALEDAIVLARCLSKKIGINNNNVDFNGNIMNLSQQKAKEALDEYLKERRLRVMLLSTQTYLTGMLLVGEPSLLLRFICIVIMAVLFRDRSNHTRYDCGKL